MSGRTDYETDASEAAGAHVSQIAPSHLPPRELADALFQSSTSHRPRLELTPPTVNRRLATEAIAPSEPEPSTQSHLISAQLQRHRGAEEADIGRGTCKSHPDTNTDVLRKHPGRIEANVKALDASSLDVL